MSLYHDYQFSPTEQSIKQIGRRLEQLRLSKNISQAEVAAKAGVSRRTISRLEAGETVALDTLIRVLKVYEIADRLSNLLPEQTVRPIERIERKGKQRQRASSKGSKSSSGRPQSDQESWSWSDWNIIKFHWFIYVF